MAKINYRKIFAKNFHSLGDISLPVIPGRNLIIGVNLSSNSSTSNGAGKSSVFESLIWSQYKKSTRGTDPSRNGKGECLTGFEFETDLGESYTVERYTSKSKKDPSWVKIKKGDEDVSHRLSSSTDDEISKLIPIPYDLFVSTNVVLQGLPINITQFTPTVRKSIIEDSVGFSEWDKIRPKFQSKIREITSKINELSSDHQSKKEQMIGMNSELETLNRVQTGRRKELKSQIFNKETELTEQQNALRKLEKRLNFLVDSSGGNLADLENQNYEIINQKARLSSSISSYKSLINNQMCPTCARPYEESKLDEARRKLSDLEPQLKELNNQTRDLEAKINDLKNAEQGVSNQRQVIGGIENNIASLKTELDNEKQSDNAVRVDTLTKEVESLNEQVNALNTEIGELEADLEKAKYIDSLLIPSSKFRTEVLLEYLGHINKIIGYITPLVFDDIQVSLAMDSKGKGIDIKIHRNNKLVNYKTLSGGEKRRLDIIVILAFQRFLIEASGINTNIVVLDEIFDGLDSKGVECVLHCVENLYPEDTAIYVITHNDSIKSQFNSVIRVIKENGVSRVEYNGGEHGDIQG